MYLLGDEESWHMVCRSFCKILQSCADSNHQGQIQVKRMSNEQTTITFWVHLIFLLELYATNLELGTIVSMCFSSIALMQS